jgi:hypothetical protein
MTVVSYNWCKLIACDAPDEACQGVLFVVPRINITRGADDKPKYQGQ